MTQKAPREQPRVSRGCSANEPVFIKCTGDDAFRARLRAGAAVWGRGRRLGSREGHALAGKQPRALGCAARLASLAWLVPAPVWAEAAAAPLFGAEHI